MNTFAIWLPVTEGDGYIVAGGDKTLKVGDEQGLIVLLREIALPGDRLRFIRGTIERERVWTKADMAGLFRRVRGIVPETWGAVKVGRGYKFPDGSEIGGEATDYSPAKHTG